MRMLCILGVFTSWISCIQCFPDGAPWDTCLTMFPKHGPQRQGSTCPFQLTLSQANYSASDVISIRIQSINAGQMFKGVQVRARPKHGDTERIVGEFTSWPENKTKSLDCLGGVRNMVTHRNSDPVLSVDLVWVAPNISVGDVEFVASFVEEFTTFWVDVTFDLPATQPATIISPAEELTQTFDVIDWSACGETMGCFLYPRTCTGYNCYAAVTYRKVNETLQFEMFGSREGYVAVGFSGDKKMGDDETISCTAKHDRLGVQRGFNHEELYNERQFKVGLTTIQGTYVDGRLFCRFIRPLAMSVYITEGHKLINTYDLTQEHYLMMAWGPIYDGTEVMGIHVELPPISDGKVNLLETKIVRGSSLPLPKQLHASLMMMAWILFVGMATVVARHFKDGFKGKMICGTKVWFQVHRTLAVLAWVFTATGFIIIFVVVGEMTENAKTHSYLGIAVMAASTLQAIGGMLRPGPDANVRPVFNWVHYLMGKATQITAGVAIFFGFNNDMVPQPQRDFAFIVLSVALAQQVFWDVWFDVERKLRKKRASENYELKNMSSKTNEDSTDYLTPVSRQRTPDTALFLYVVCVVAVSSAALAAVFLF